MSAAGTDGGQPVWTPSRTELLVHHYHAGLSAAQSAALIGTVSKNAVISKRRRLGLMAVVEVGRGPGAWSGLTAPRSRCDTGRIRLLRGPPPLPTAPLPQMDLPPPADANPKLLPERRFGECAWPLGPAEEAGGHRTLFCGAPTRAIGPYCAAHAARAYREAPC